MKNNMKMICAILAEIMPMMKNVDPKIWIILSMALSVISSFFANNNSVSKDSLGDAEERYYIKSCDERIGVDGMFINLQLPILGNGVVLELKFPEDDGYIELAMRIGALNLDARFKVRRSVVVDAVS